MTRRFRRAGIPARGQRGFALIVIISLIVLVSAYLLLKQLNASSGFVADNRNHNAKVLNQAKRALIGYVAQQTSQAGENNPGRLPCPEAVNNIGTSTEGISAPSIVPSTPNCAMVGRLPWRTLGLDKLLDTASEPLWYVVSPGWMLQNSSTLLSINSNTQGQLVVDELPVPNEVIALIIAPGPAMNVQAATGCTARAQSRSAPSPSIDPLDYIECFNSATSTFSTTGPSTAFNDQVLRVTTADLVPQIEAAIANRIEREIVPALKTVYADPKWGSGISAAKPLFPYPAPFGISPFPNPDTSNFQGAAVTVAGAPQGLLPFNQTQGCDLAPDVRCTTTLTAWASPAPAPPPDVTQTGGYGYFLLPKTCSWQSDDVALCQGQYHEDISNPSGSGMVISMTATINNVAMGLRVLDTAKATIAAKDDTQTTWTTITPSLTATMNSNGSVTITLRGTLPNIDAMGWTTYADYRIRLERSVIGDHPLLDPANATTGWFVRNEWYRLLYYAVAPGHTAAALPTPSCTTAVSCLSVANVTPTNAQRAILILGGRSVNGTARPSATLADYLESGNATGAFTRKTVSASAAIPLAQRFNDRIVVLDSN
jgi:hypothetical protein